MGTILIHSCSSDTCGERPWCDDDLVGSLRLYAPFIKRFCIGLEKLTIFAGKDRDHMQPLSSYTCEEALLGLLNNEIRQIDSPKELVVLDEDGERSLPVAKKTTTWFRK